MRDVTLTIPVPFPPLPPGSRVGLSDANAAHLSVYHTTGKGFWACASPCKLFEDNTVQIALCDPRSITARYFGGTRYSAKTQARLEARLRATADLIAVSLASGLLTDVTLRETLEAA